MLAPTLPRAWVCRDMPVTQPLLWPVPSTEDSSGQVGEWKARQRDFTLSFRKEPVVRGRKQKPHSQGGGGQRVGDKDKNGLPYKSQHPGPLPSAAP